MIGRLALIVGLFVVPTILLALGHKLRERSPALRGAFWGGVIGHSSALLVGITVLHYPPVLWTGPARTLAAFWILLLGGAFGALIGAWRAGRNG